MSGLFYWRCGDVCVPWAGGNWHDYDSAEQSCTCGVETFGPYDSKWCCGTNCTGGCLKWKQKPLKEGGGYYEEGDDPGNCAEWTPVICTNGIALPLNQSCNNGFCNEHLSDEYRNFESSRSYVAACANTSICVKEGEGNTGIAGGYTPTICTGNSSCEGELTWCQRDERKNETCPVGFSRCSPTLGGSKKKKDSSSGKNGIPGQCIEPAKAQDGVINHCLDRTDENPFEEAGTSTNQQQIDFAQLKSCEGEDGVPGMECGSGEDSGSGSGEYSITCREMFYWCKEEEEEECSVLGTDIFTNNPRVCQEYKLWEDKPCWEDEIRCKAGYSGQCVLCEDWGVEEDREGWVGGCKDRSDLYRPIVKGEEPGSQTSQTDNNGYSKKDKQSGDRDSYNFVKGEESLIPQVWNTRPLNEKDFNELGKEERAKYRKDSSTGLWMIPVTEETCMANDGFVCKVRFGATE